MKSKSEAKTAPAELAAPLPQASASWSQLPTQVFDGWQRQWNANLRLMDVMLGNAARLRDAQMPAMGEEIARCVELQQALLAAKSPYEAWSCQCNWMLESATRAMAMWRDLLEAAGTANQGMLSCIGEAAAKQAAELPLAQASVSAQSTSVAPPDLVKTALVSIDAAYGEMVKGTQQMMAAASEALSAGLGLSLPVAPAAGEKPAGKRRSM